MQQVTYNDNDDGENNTLGLQNGKLTYEKDKPSISAKIIEIRERETDQLVFEG